MAIATHKLNTSSPSSKSVKIHYFGQIFLRILAFGSTLASACIMLTNKQTTVVYGIPMDARYTYSPAFKFFAGANIVAAALSVLSLVVVGVMERKGVKDSTHYFFLFIHDLIVTVLLMAALGAALAISYVGKYGNIHSGWLAICDHFGKYCNTSVASVVLGFLGEIAYLFLTIISANRSTHIQS